MYPSVSVITGSSADGVIKAPVQASTITGDSSMQPQHIYACDDAPLVLVMILEVFTLFIP